MGLGDRVASLALLFLVEKSGCGCGELGRALGYDARIGIVVVGERICIESAEREEDKKVVSARFVLFELRVAGDKMLEFERWKSSHYIETARCG